MAVATASLFLDAAYLVSIWPLSPLIKHVARRSHRPSNPPLSHAQPSVALVRHHSRSPVLFVLFDLHLVRSLLLDPSSNLLNNTFIVSAHPHGPFSHLALAALRRHRRRLGHRFGWKSGEPSFSLQPPFSPYLSWASRGSLSSTLRDQQSGLLLFLASVHCAIC